MIAKWDSMFLVACDSACIISGVSWFSFLASDERSMSLNDIDKPSNAASPVTLVVLGGAMAPVVVIALKFKIQEYISEIG